jgi:hypothetical protein
VNRSLKRWRRQDLALAAVATGIALWLGATAPAVSPVASVAATVSTAAASGDANGPVTGGVATVRDDDDAVLRPDDSRTGRGGRS